jgi:hypothetical protein
MGWAVRGSSPGGCEIFRSHPEWPQGPPSLLYNGYYVSFAGVKWPGHGINYPLHLVPRLKKEYCYISIPPLGLHGLLQGESYLFFFFPFMTVGMYEVSLC